MGYGPGPIRSLCTISSNSFNIARSTLNSHSKYWQSDKKANTIFAKRSSMPTGVGGEAEEAGDNVEYIGEGVSRGELKGSINRLMPHCAAVMGRVEGGCC